MNSLIVFAHPNPNSFNAAIVNSLAQELQNNNVEYKVKDLYKMNFNPVLSANDFEKMTKGEIPDDIKNEQQDVSWADTIFFVYPTWWTEQPAILKGWIDRVFSQGFAYTYDDTGFKGLLNGKKAVVISTWGNDENIIKRSGLDSASKKCMMDGTFRICNFDEVIEKSFYAVPRVSDKDRKEMLDDVKNIVDEVVIH